MLKFGLNMFVCFDPIIVACILYDNTVSSRQDFQTNV